MAHDQTIRSRHPFAWDGEKLEANLPTMQRQPKEQNRPMPERDERSSADQEGIDPVRCLGLELSQLRMGWYCG